MAFIIKIHYKTMHFTLDLMNVAAPEAGTSLAPI